MHVHVCVHVVGASVSEPHTSKFNCRF